MYKLREILPSAVLWRNQLPVPPRRPCFDPGPPHVRFVVHKVELWQVFLRVLLSSPVSITPLVLHVPLRLSTAIIVRTSGRARAPCKQSSAVPYIEEALVRTSTPYCSVLPSVLGGNSMQFIRNKPTFRRNHITSTCSASARRRHVCSRLVLCTFLCVLHPAGTFGVRQYRSLQIAGRTSMQRVFHWLAQPPTHSHFSRLRTDLVIQGDSREVLTYVAVLL
jgi:hypothetical protein